MSPELRLREDGRRRIGESGRVASQKEDIR